MKLAFFRRKTPYLADNAEARDTIFHREELVASQAVPEGDANAVCASYSCRLEPWRYGLASITSTQNYNATIGASTVRLLAEGAALGQTDNLESFAITAVVDPLEEVAANSDRRRLGRVDNVSPMLIPLLRRNAVVDPLEEFATNLDRRRLGRVDDVSPTLIPLLRHDTETGRTFENDFENDLGPASGVIMSLELSILFWGVIAFAVWFFVWR